jgi:hypothetical protein
MATTGIITDDTLYVLIGATKFDHITSCSLTIGSETIDITSYDSSSRKEIVPGDTNWSVSIEAHYAMDATEGGDEAATAILAGTAQTILISTEVQGDTTYTGSGYVTNVSISSSKNSSTTVSVSYEGTGQLTAGTVA